MAISNEQLQSWAKAPASTKSEYTYRQIKEALSRSKDLKKHAYEVYLQGSYANSTNIRVDSDIDVVTQLKSTFSPGISKLSSFQKEQFQLAYPTNATYQWGEFRQDVINALSSYFGYTRINKRGNKSIKLLGDEYSLNADIIPCLEYRNYKSFDLSKRNDYVEGMKFWTVNEGKEIINYPRVHIKHGEDKNATHRTDEMYKDLVRILKSIRKKMVEGKKFNPKTAPSYFVECMVYNTPDIHFDGTHKESLESNFDFLEHCVPSKLLTVSHQHTLLGPEPWQWHIEDARLFLSSALSYYQQN